MLTIPSTPKIFCCQQPVDMRKGFEGLGAIVEESFEERVASGSYFVFINRRRNLMKVLYWDGDGLAIWYKRLERGGFARDRGRALSRREFLMLLEGIEPKRLRKQYRLKPLAKE